VRFANVCFFIAEVLMGFPTVVGTGAEVEEIYHTLVEGMRANDLRRHHLRILHETMPGTLGID